VWTFVAVQAAKDAAETLGHGYAVRVPSVELEDDIEDPCAEAMVSLMRYRVQRREIDEVVGGKLRKLALDAGDGERSLERWYLGAIALKPFGTDEWKSWRESMTSALIRSQRPDGSWSSGTSEDLSARVRATAIAVLCLRTATTP
jgi:hypothetical protein